MIDDRGQYPGVLHNFPDDDSQWVAAVSGGGLQFDGIDDYVDLERCPPIAGAGPRTIAAWIRLAERPAANQAILAWREPVPNGYWLLEVDPTRRLRFSCGAGVGNASNADQTVDYVVNAWDMDDPGLSAGNKGKQKDAPSKLSRIPRPAERIYLADNEAGPWRPVILNRKDLDMASVFNLLDVWSTTHMAASAQETVGNNLTRRVAADRHRNKGCNNLFFDGHSTWLSAEENTSRYWCGVEAG